VDAKQVISEIYQKVDDLISRIKEDIVNSERLI